MAVVKHGLSYLWVTWLTKLLAGEDQCEWASWFKAHHRYDKVPREDSRLAQWSADHTALLNLRVAALRADGWQVWLENANKFEIKGQAAILGGKMDYVAVKPNRILVGDAKTGAQRNSDWWQVLTYFFALPLAFPERVQGRTVEGEIVYKGAPSKPMQIPYTDLTAERKQQIVSAIQRVAGRTPLTAVPSASECQFCDISQGDCSVRFGEGTQVDVLTSEF